MIKFKILSILLFLILHASCESELSYNQKRYKYDEFVKKSNSLIEKREYNGALSKAKSAIKIIDTLPSAFVSQGIALYHLGELKDARKSFDKVIEIEGNQSKSYKLRALVYLKMNNSDFVKDIDQYLKYYDDEEAHEMRRDYFEARNDYNEAIKGYSLAIGKFKDSVELYLKRSELYIQNGDYDEAINDYNSILSIRPNSLEIESKKASLENKIHFNKNRNILIKILIGIFVAYIFISRVILRPIVLKKAENQIGGVYTVGRDPFAWLLPFILIMVFFAMSHYEIIPNF